MHRVKRVFLGLPKYFVDNILWVAREYRTNPLSHEPGGSDVVIEYHNDSIYCYDWIKFPSKYVSKIWTKGISEIYEDYENWDEDEQMEEIRKEIRCIYARKYNKENFETVSFKEIWKSETSEVNPWKLLKEYDNKDRFNSYSNLKKKYY